jgi:hypothetical protein
MRVVYAAAWVAAALVSGATLMNAFGVGWRMPQDAAAVVASEPSERAISGSGSLAGKATLTSETGKESEKKSEPEKAAATEGTEVPKEPVEKRIVPVISLGDGARIGAVQVGGPKSYVDQVKAVVMLEGDYKDVVRYRVLIPIKTEKVIEKIERVPFVSVTGIVDLKVS